MIFDHIQYRRFYENNAALEQVLTFMKGISSANFPNKTTRLNGERCYVNPVCLETKPEKECRFEAHRRYADVHYIVEGCEKIIVHPLDTLTATHNYNTIDDIGFYQGDGGSICLLYPGDFLVCYPHDAHKTAVCVNEPLPIKKLVGKIKLL